MTGADDFLSALYAGQSGTLELRTFDHAHTNRVRHEFLSVQNGQFDLAQVEGFVRNMDREKLGAFFGVALRTQTAAKSRKGDAQHCQVLTALFVDADYKHNGEEATRQRIDSFPLPPSAIVCSGAGLHPYWFLEDPILLHVGDGMARAKSALRRMARGLADVVDESVSEPVRVLRVPGSNNYKFDPCRPVVLEAISECRRYPLAELLAVLPTDDATTSNTPFAVPDEIAKGDRHGTLFALLRSCKARRLSLAAALACCHAENLEKCHPPIEHDTLDSYLRRSWDEADRPGFVQAESGFIKVKDKVVARSQDNLRLALAKLNVDLSYDLFSQKPRVRYLGYDGPLDDKIRNRLFMEIEAQFQFLPPADYFDVFLSDTAHRNAYHPVRDYLDALRWDGTARLDRWLAAYGAADDAPYTRAVGALVLVAAVRRVRQPGCKFDEMLVLESGQGFAKSTMLAALCPKQEWFSDDLPLNVDSKQVIERTGGKWIIEAADLSGMRASQAEHLKALLSRQFDGPVRLAYARLPVEQPRQFVVIGTTNNLNGYLQDATGNRRFWPVRVVTFDVAALRRDRDQLWAEAAAREATGASIRLDPSLWAAAGRQQEDRRSVDPWEEVLLDSTIEFKHKERGVYIAASVVWETLGMVSADKRDRRHQERLVAIMQRLGYPRKHKCKPYGMDRAVYWIREGAAIPGELPEGEV